MGRIRDLRAWWWEGHRGRGWQNREKARASREEGGGGRQGGKVTGNWVTAANGGERARAAGNPEGFYCVALQVLYADSQHNSS